MERCQHHISLESLLSPCCYMLFLPVLSPWFEAGFVVFFWALPGEEGCEIKSVLQLRFLGLFSVSAVPPMCTTQLPKQRWPRQTADELFRSCQPKLSLKPAANNLVFIIIQNLHRPPSVPPTSPTTHTRRRNKHICRLTAAPSPGIHQGPWSENAPSSSRGQAWL